MQFSEAIRKGAKMHPQIKGMLYDGVGTCANGAAQFGDGRRKLGDPVCDEFSVTTNAYVWSWLHRNPFNSPCGCDDAGMMGFMKNYVGFVSHLNDHHEWSREAISEWVEVEERKLGLWDNEGIKDSLCKDTEESTDVSEHPSQEVVGTGQEADIARRNGPVLV